MEEIIFPFRVNLNTLFPRDFHYSIQAELKKQNIFDDAIKLK